MSGIKRLIQAASKGKQVPTNAEIKAAATKKPAAKKK